MTKTKSHHANGRIGPLWAAITLATAVALFIGAAWWVGLREPQVVMHYPDDVREAWEQENRTPDVVSPMRDRGVLQHPLAIGSALPLMEPLGWVNGRPDRYQDRVVVVDVWDDS